MARRQAATRRRSPKTPVARGPKALQRLLEKTVATLRAAKIPFAVVGGTAVGVRAQPRVTRDLDIAVEAASDAEAERVIHALQAAGYRVESLFENDAGRISTVRTMRSNIPGIFVDFLIHNSRIEAEIIRDATPIALPGIGEVPVVSLDHLLAMKVLAARSKDLADIEHLLLRATPDQLEKTRSALAIISARGAARARDLLAEFDDHVDAVLKRPAFERPVSKARLKKILGKRD